MTFFPNPPNPKTQTGDLRVAESISGIDLPSFYGVSDLRNLSTITGSASAVVEAGELKISTTASGSDAIVIDSAGKVRLNAGTQASVGMTGRRAVAPTGNQVYRVGPFDDDNGFGIGEDATGAFTFDRSGGVETKVYQPDWNADILDGTGPSGLIANLADGGFLTISFNCYCYGDVEYVFTFFDSVSGVNKTAVAHRLRKLGEVQTQNPNMPIRVDVDNGGTATAFELFIGARSFRSFTPNDSPNRVVSDYRLGLTPSTAFIPTVTLRRKTAFTSVQALIEGYDIISDSDLVVQVRINGSLTGASFGTPADATAAETAFESDTSATAITGGLVVWEGLIQGGVKGNERGGGKQGLVDIEIPDVQNVTLCVRTTSGTATSVETVLRVTENW